MLSCKVSEEDCLPEWDINHTYRVDGPYTAAVNLSLSQASNLGRCLDLCQRAQSGTCASINFDRRHKICYLQAENKTQAVKRGALVEDEYFIHMEMTCTGKKVEV